MAGLTESRLGVPPAKFFPNEQTTIPTTMAYTHLPATPKKPRTSRREHETLKKAQLLGAVARNKDKTLKDIYDKEKIPERTARRWRKTQRELGNSAVRRARKQSTRLGRPFKLSDEQLDQLLAIKNPVRGEHYECQIKEFKLRVCPRTLQRAFKNRRRNAKLYKRAKVTAIRKENKQKRITYRQENRDETLDSLWKWVHYTDEAHIDPSAQSNGSILREEGTRYEPENIAEIPKLNGVVFHVAASCSWWHKSQLQFYNDEYDETFEIKLPRPRKPIRRKRETQDEYNQRYAEYEAQKPHDVDAKKTGNSMTQLYYTEHILPVYVGLIQDARLDDELHTWKLQEDNDPSHGTRKPGLAQYYKDQNWIDCLIHPAQSPNLNSIEALWNILKQRLRRLPCNRMSRAELKQTIIQLWDEIGLDEVRSRIADIPRRCRVLCSNGGKVIKSSTW